jgi:hypothetical protein
VGASCQHIREGGKLRCVGASCQHVGISSPLEDRVSRGYMYLDIENSETPTRGLTMFMGNGHMDQELSLEG